MNKLCWLVEAPEDPPAFERLLTLLEEDVPGACVAEHEEGRYTVFSVFNATPSLRRWAAEGLPVWEMGARPDLLVEAYEEAHGG